MARADLLELHAREALGMGDTWHAYEFRAEQNPGRPGQLVHYTVRGCIAPPLTRGPRAGKPNFRKPEPGSARTLYLTPAEHGAWLDAWEQRTGLCRACAGHGKEMTAWSVTQGATYRPCPSCQGSGSAPVLAVTAEPAP